MPPANVNMMATAYCVTIKQGGQQFAPAAIYSLLCNNGYNIILKRVLVEWNQNKMVNYN